MKYLLVFLIFSITKLVSASELDALLMDNCDGPALTVVKKVISWESRGYHKGKIQPWPWTLNVNGRPLFFSSKAQALEVAEYHIVKGAWVDLGFGQVSWNYHHDKFSSVAQALEPSTNIRAACSILNKGFSKHSDTRTAVAYYHRNQLGERAFKYADKVLQSI